MLSIYNNTNETENVGPVLNTIWFIIMQRNVKIWKPLLNAFWLRKVKLFLCIVLIQKPIHALYDCHSYLVMNLILIKVCVSVYGGLVLVLGSLENFTLKP